jgi:hypothetical protein
MGIENIATDSDNQIFESSKVEQIVGKRYPRLIKIATCRY